MSIAFTAIKFVSKLEQVATIPVALSLSSRLSVINWRKTYSNVHFVPTEPPSVSFSPKANQLTILSSFQHLSFRYLRI
ncbi:MAG: hypothetical protein ACTS7D_01285 [Candidatus Hodgkinia cicadicola]